MDEKNTENELKSFEYHLLKHTDPTHPKVKLIESLMNCVEVEAEKRAYEKIRNRYGDLNIIKTSQIALLEEMLDEATESLSHECIGFIEDKLNQLKK